MPSPAVRWPVAIALGLSAAAYSWWHGRSARSLATAAHLVERVDPSCRNVVITAVELLAHPDRGAPWMRARVIGDAHERAARINPADARSLVGPIVILAATVMVDAALVLALIKGWPQRAIASLAPVKTAPGAVARQAPATIRVRLQPPAYTGSPGRDLENPERIDALQGTAVRLSVTDPSGSRRIRFGTRPLDAQRIGDDVVADVVLSESGYFAIEPAVGSPEALLLPVLVSPDRAPVIRLEAPGKDLLLPNATGRIPIAVSASDDFGLQSLELRYTRVSGTGEQFEFQEGSLPAAVTRQSARDWKLTAEIPLASLKLEPGDSLVYRAIGRDARPGDAGVASSDTFFVEIAGPGQVALDGFDLPPDRERYALSQQMIVLKIARLRARERTRSPKALVEETTTIAGEQRAVRANFIFLMGGHVEDEEVEAEQASEIAEGRLQNRAHQDIGAAVRFMTAAEQALAATSTEPALRAARAAAEALQRAFGRNRYILRTAPVRSRVDPSRRMTGDLSEAADWRRSLVAAPPDRDTTEARLVLSRLLELAEASGAERRMDPGALGALAERALSVAPGSPDWQAVAAGVTRLRDAVASGRAGREVRDRLDELVRLLSALGGRGALVPQVPATSRAGALSSAWAESERRR
jgi:hypothetical protein